MSTDQSIKRRSFRLPLTGVRDAISRAFGALVCLQTTTPTPTYYIVASEAQAEEVLAQAGDVANPVVVVVESALARSLIQASFATGEYASPFIDMTRRR
jgi:hypothetical protein